MPKFSRPKRVDIPENVKESFHKEFSEISENVVLESKLEKEIKKPKEPIKKISLNMRAGDIQRSNDILNKLIDNGLRNPIPTATDIHRMGILYLSKASDDKLKELFEKIIQ